MEWVLLVFVGIVALALIDEYRPRSPESEWRHLHWKWEQDCKRRGLTQEQQSAEYKFRVAWICLRRRVNEAALVDPENYETAISDIAKEEANRLALFDKRVAKRFLDVVVATKPYQIPYADGMKAIDVSMEPVLEAARKTVEEYKKTADYARLWKIN